MLLVAGELFLLGLVGAGVSWEFARMNQAVDELSELKDPSPFRSVLMGNLEKVHIALQGFLRSADPAMEEQIAKSLQEFQSSIPEFQKQNAKLFPKQAVEEIGLAFSGLKKSIEELLKLNVRRQASRTKLEAGFARIITLLEQNVRPLIRDHQPDAAERREAALNIENQVRAWQQSLMRSWTAPASQDAATVYEIENRGASYLERYSGMQLLARERKVVKAIQTLWDETGSMMPASFALEKTVLEMASFVSAQREQVVLALNKYLPALSPAELEDLKQGFIRSMRIHGVVSVILVLLALVSVYFSVGVVGRTLRSIPLRPAKPAPVSGVMLKMNLKGVLTGWSAEAERLYGYTSDDVLGETIDKLFESKEDLERLSQELAKSHSTSFVSTHKDQNGVFFRARMDFHPVMDAQGHVSAIGITCHKT